MIVFAIGMPRSASTWAYNVCRLILSTTGTQPKVGFAGQPKEVDAALAAPAPEDGHVLLKTHRGSARLAALVRQGRARAVYTYRDPRDAVISLMRKFGDPFPTAAREILLSLALWNRVSDSPAALALSFEDIESEPAACVDRIGRHLGLPPDPAQRAAIVERLDLDTVKGMTRKLDWVPEERIFQTVQGRPVDGLTQLHEGHIVGVERGEWRRHLSPAQRAELERAFGPWLARLGYGAAGTDGA